MSDDKLDELIDREAPGHNAPLEIPRERMWAGIDARRRPPRHQLRSGKRVQLWPRITVPVAAAAILLLGIALGRWTADEGSQTSPLEIVDATPPVVSEQGATAQKRIPSAYAVAAREHLQQSEMLLTMFRSQSTSPEPVSGLESWAGRLLAQTRLLKDSPAGQDPQLYRLLDDLELAFAQIVQLEASGQPEDNDWIAAGLEKRSLLQRIRTTGASKPGSTRL